MVLTQTWHDQTDLVGMPFAWKRPGVGQMCQNGSLHSSKRFVLWVVEYLIVLTHTHGTLWPNLLFLANSLVNRQRGKSRIQKTCPGFNPCIVHICLTFR